MNKAFEMILERLEEREKHIKNTQEGTWFQLGFNVAKEIVQEVEKEYNYGWISCDERLPEECIEVLVSVKEIDGSFYTRTSWMQDGVWVIKKTPLRPTVIAWQPLPEPYKAE